jgi:hypothetical protein
MNILNADVDFSRAEQRVKDAFLGPPAKRIFKAEATIYRFISLRDVPSPDGTTGGSPLFESPWWVPEETFRTITFRTNRTHRPLIAVARTGLAVQYEFNPHMDWLLIAKLKDPAYGWFGEAAAQPERAHDRKVWLLGGLPQIWLPGLAAGGDGTSSPHAFIDYFGPIDEP